MQIIFGRENAEKLREKYTVLDLETVDVDGQSMDVFCLIPAEKLSISELPKLDEWKKLHQDMITGYQKKEYEYVRQCIEHLMGKFGGEADSFYMEVLARMEQEVIQYKSNNTI